MSDLDRNTSSETPAYDGRPPRERFAGPEHLFDLGAVAESLHGESSPLRDGHRQQTIFHRSHLTLVVFDFVEGGRLNAHRAMAPVTIHAFSGRLEVSTGTSVYQLAAGSLLALDPGVVHDVHAVEPSRMLLSVGAVTDPE